MEHLLHSCREPLLRRIRARLGPALRSRTEAEDILHEACLRLLRSPQARLVLNGDLPERGFLAWMTRVIDHEVRYTVRRFQKKQRPRHNAALPQYALEYSEQSTFEPRARSTEPLEGELMASELEPLRGLSFDRRMAVVARHLLGLSWDATAFLIGDRSASAARNLIHRAQTELPAHAGRADRDAS